MTASEAISAANALLPGPGDDNLDGRWQAIIKIGEYIESEPEAVWTFVQCWGGHDIEDVRDAVATLLLEHLLEHHFARIMPRVLRAVEGDPMFADMFCRCWKYGQAASPENAAEFDRVQELAAHMSNGR
ncbi:hypothetical protein OAS39_04580 [Pirellulales bacterium]|nr:hypothetical protein [Pirellulales bacterium]